MSDALANGLTALDAFCGSSLDDSKALVLAKCRALLVGYAHRWANDGYTTTAVEQVYTAPLWNPATNANSRSFMVAGKVDVDCQRGGMNYIIDHKFTSQDFSDPNAAYWQQLRVEGQATHYMLLEWLNGRKVDGAVWDVIHRPTISPKKLTKADRASAVADQKYCGQRLSMETLTALQTEERETLEMYEARLIHDCTVERPEWYFMRRAVPRLDAEVMEYAEDLWQHGQNILASRKIKRLPKNSGACFQYNSPCTFLGICSGYDRPDSDRWRKRDIRHKELGEAGRMDALTNSRIRTYQSCAVKHRYTYEIGIERQDDEDREALYSGSLLHAGLEAYWKTFLPQETQDVDSSEAATSGASA